LINILDAWQPIFIVSVLVVSTVFMAFDNALKNCLSLVSLKLKQSKSKKVAGGMGLPKETGIGKLYLGIFGGFVGIVIAGLIMEIMTSSLQNIWFPGIILCGALGGLGFGALTSGDKRLRGVLGCVFGVIAVLFGLLTTYSNPIVVGHMQPYG
jgi:hypothetical protein